MRNIYASFPITSSKMKKLFFLSILALILFEIANIYFIMPIPGSQEMNSIDLAYFLYSWRWVFRTGLGLLIVYSFFKGNWKRRWIPVFVAIFAGFVAYLANFQMAADSIFLQPQSVEMKSAQESIVDSNRIILGTVFNGEARAYPIQYLGYHHQVLDTIGGKPIMVTYCTVCRTGRIFEPVVNGKPEIFRLVGMDHFNAMFEDQTTKSWWRQVSGEAIAGELKGQVLPEFFSSQTELKQWLSFYPNSLIMQPDIHFQEKYDSMSNYENGNREGRLTRRDTASWEEKSWVVGISMEAGSKAYDWNTLEEENIIHDEINRQPVLLVLADDRKSFFAFEREDMNQQFVFQHDTLISEGKRYTLEGKSLDSSIPHLTKIKAYQEYWHSWRTFHPETLKHRE